MLKKTRKINVFTLLQNNKGFSLISTLIIITIILMTMPFISYLLKNSTLIEEHDDISIRQFFMFMEDDIFNAERLSVKQGELLLETNGNVAIYKLFNGTVRRQLKGGQEIYLRNVINFQAVKNEYGCKLFVTNINGETYEKLYTFFKE